VDAVAAVWDEPFGDSSAWATFQVSRLARRHVTVALSGDGGDELFCGYQWYSKWLLNRSTPVTRLLSAVLPAFSAGARSMTRRATTGLERYAAFLSPFTPRQRMLLLAPDFTGGDYDDLWHFREHWREDLEPLKRMQWADLHTYLPGDLLLKVDRASMAHSLEVRPPLLDHRLVEFALSLDSRLLRDVEGGKGKLVLRRLVGPRVPAGLFDRKKRGFNLPIRTWVRQHRGMVESAVARLARAGLIRQRPTVGFSHEQIWMLLTLDRWLVRTGAL
ncbi:MAG: asparagine synthetase B family protein, partial [Steroidobacteraceae bacterium]